MISMMGYRGTDYAKQSEVVWAESEKFMLQRRQQNGLLTRERYAMSDFSSTLLQCLDITGASAISVIDRTSGSVLEVRGEFPRFREMIDHAIEMVRVGFGPDTPLDEEADDILLTTRHTYQIFAFLTAPDCAGLFIFLVLQRPEANLAFARHKVGELVKQITLSPETVQDLFCRRRNAERQQFSKETLFVPDIAEEEEELPPFMRHDTVMQLLNMEQEYVDK